MWIWITTFEHHLKSGSPKVCHAKWQTFPDLSLNSVPCPNLLALTPTEAEFGNDARFLCQIDCRSFPGSRLALSKHTLDNVRKTPVLGFTGGLDSGKVPNREPSQRPWPKCPWLLVGRNRPKCSDSNFCQNPKIYLQPQSRLFFAHILMQQAWTFVHLDSEHSYRSRANIWSAVWKSGGLDWYQIGPLGIRPHHSDSPIKPTVCTERNSKSHRNSTQSSWLDENSFANCSWKMLEASGSSFVPQTIKYTDECGFARKTCTRFEPAQQNMATSAITHQESGSVVDLCVFLHFCLIKTNTACYLNKTKGTSLGSAVMDKTQHTANLMQFAWFICFWHRKNCFSGTGEYKRENYTVLATFRNHSNKQVTWWNKSTSLQRFPPAVTLLNADLRRVTQPEIWSARAAGSQPDLLKSWFSGSGRETLATNLDETKFELPPVLEWNLTWFDYFLFFVQNMAKT